MIRSPLRLKDGFGRKTGLAIELFIAFLAALFCLETLVSPYFFISHRSNFPENTPMHRVLGKSMTKWHTIQKEAEVKIKC